MTYQTIVTAAAPTLDLFLRAGFPTSRNMVPLEGKPLLIRAIECTSHPDLPAVVVVNREEEDSRFGCAAELGASARVRAVIESSSAVKGALPSALLGMGHADLDKPLLLAPGDSVLATPFWELLELAPKEASAFTLAFESSNPRWSFLKENEKGEVIQVAEKRAVGRLATTGHFFFRSAQDFLEAATWVLANNAMVQGRFFVSTAFNYLISQGKLISSIQIDRDQYSSYSKPYDFIRQED